MMPSDKKITRENAKDIIKQFAKEQNSFFEISIIEFTDHEKEAFLKEWPKKEKDFYSRIIPRFAYNGPIKESTI